MFFVDRDRALRELWRVLAHGGTLAVAVWDSLENTPAYAAEVDLIQRMVSKDAADILRAPFALGDPDALQELFVGAGISSPGVSTHRGQARFASVRAMLDADIKAWLPLAGLVLSDEETAAVVAEGERSLSEFVMPDGTVEFVVPAHIVTASK
jgi:hypothetical protein